MTLVASCSNGYHTYIPTPHSFDFFAYEAGKTKYFPGTAAKFFLARDQQTAELVLQQPTVKLLFNESNVVVGIDS